MAGLRVLFANDDVVTQWVMSDALGKAGCEVVSVCRAEHLSELLLAGEEFDLLLIDVGLPGLADSAALRQWRQAMQHRPIIYTGPSRAALPATLTRADSFLAAPFCAFDLLEVVEESMADTMLLPIAPVAASGLSVLH